MDQVERSDKTWSTGEGNAKPLQYSCLDNPMNSMKRQKDITLMFLSRETGMSGNFVGRIKGAKYRFDLQYLKWDFS